MIPAVIERCAGIDVGKTFLTVCLLTGPADGEPKVETRKFGTFYADLEALRRWLTEEQCARAVMESTGCYWKPVFNVLEESVPIFLANGQDVKGRKGHKLIGTTAGGWPIFFVMGSSGPVSSRQNQCESCET